MPPGFTRLQQPGMYNATKAKTIAMHLILIFTSPNQFLEPFPDYKHVKTIDNSILTLILANSGTYGCLPAEESSPGTRHLEVYRTLITLAREKIEFRTN